MLESEIMGSKALQYEIVGESKENLLMRFLIHFIYTNHEGYNVELFEHKKNPKPSISAVSPKMRASSR
jgi:hypothetical protein